MVEEPQSNGRGKETARSKAENEMPALRKDDPGAGLSHNAAHEPPAANKHGDTTAAVTASVWSWTERNYHSAWDGPVLRNWRARRFRGCCRRGI